MQASGDPILLFPGQGTEAVGMGRGWEGQTPWVRTLEAAEAHTGKPLRRLMEQGPLEDLRAQRVAPYAVLAHAVGVCRSWEVAGLHPCAASGHSMGFYSALVAAEVIPLEAALHLFDAVEDLSEAAFAATPMGMAFVIGVDEAELAAALSARPELARSNRNGRAQFTVSGPRASLERLVEDLAPIALKVGLLPVRHPLHGPAMTPLVPEVARRLAHVRPVRPRFPLIAPSDGRLITEAEEAWREGLHTVALAVDWLAVVDTLVRLGAPLGECGFGAQLSGLTRWADRRLEVRSLQMPPAP